MKEIIYLEKKSEQEYFEYYFYITNNLEQNISSIKDINLGTIGFKFDKRNPIEISHHYYPNSPDNNLYYPILIEIIMKMIRDDLYLDNTLIKFKIVDRKVDDMTEIEIGSEDEHNFNPDYYDEKEIEEENDDEEEQ